METEIIKTLGPWGLVVLGLIYIFVTKIHKPSAAERPLGLDQQELKAVVKEAVEDVLAPSLDRMEHAMALQSKSVDVLAATNQNIQVSMEGIKVLLEVQMNRKGRL